MLKKAAFILSFLGFLLTGSPNLIASSDSYLLPPNPKDQIYGVKNRLFNKKSRFAVTMGYGFNANDELLTSHMAKLDLGYHISEELEVFSILGFGFLHSETFNYQKAISMIGEDASLSPLISKIKVFSSLGLRYNFLYGKVKGLFGEIWHFDAFIGAGPALILSEAYGNYRSPAKKEKRTNIGGLLHGGSRFFINKNFIWGANFDFYLYKETYKADKGFLGSRSKKTVSELRKVLEPTLFAGWIF